MPPNPDFQLKRLRKKLGLPQREMARRMGLSLRPYQQLEFNPDKVRKRHVRLAESVSLDVALEKEDPALVLKSMRDKAIGLVRLIFREGFREQASEFADRLLDLR